MASVPLGGPALDPSGHLRAARGVAVCDASVVPGAPGVNPMVTIQAVARVVAAALVADLTGWSGYHPRPLIEARARSESSGC